MCNTLVSPSDFALGGDLQMDEEILSIMHELREFMFEKVYLREETLNQRSEAKKIVIKIRQRIPFCFFCKIKWLYY